MTDNLGWLIFLMIATILTAGAIVATVACIALEHAERRDRERRNG